MSCTMMISKLVKLSCHLNWIMKLDPEWIQLEELDHECSIGHWKVLQVSYVACG